MQNLYLEQCLRHFLHIERTVLVWVRETDPQIYESGRKLKRLSSLTLSMVGAKRISSCNSWKEHFSL